MNMLSKGYLDYATLMESVSDSSVNVMHMTSLIQVILLGLYKGAGLG